jgi:G3E family GTPase
VRVTLVYGFLGAGKTTFLRRLIPSFLKLGRTAVLVNEFGHENIDGTVLRSTDLQVRELTGGCICCEVRGDLIAALAQIGREVRPDRLVIEPTGLAAPQMLGHILAMPTIREVAKVDSVVTVVDATRYGVARQAFGDFYVEQIRMADVLLINKADVATAEETETARDAARTLNPDAALAVTTRAAMDPDIVLAAIATDRTESTLDEPTRTHGEQEELSTLGLEHATIRPPELTRAQLDSWLNALAHGDFGDIVRAKGFARLDNTTALVDVVMGAVEVRSFNPVPARIEIIGRNLDPRSMEKHLANGSTNIPSPTLS